MGGLMSNAILSGLSIKVPCVVCSSVSLSLTPPMVEKERNNNIGNNKLMGFFVY